MAATSFTEDQLRQMLALSRESLLSAFELCDKPQVPGWLEAPGSCFVTLTSHGRLRGCIGTLEPVRSLGRDLIENARNAAFSDPRFSPLERNELGDIELEVSVLTPALQINVDTEAELLAELRPGVDGVIVEEEGCRATFLPTVWEQLPEPQEFIAALRSKAGLSPFAWSDRMRWYRYETQHAKGRLLVNE
ncbi:AmmeMemoRadiSam system protein A [Marinobacterium sp. D7]|uniref:AmmeMemoRadiSam system protein A n=1 Tax=Marinobacterium ramblicola TaxID=2849041 RepID=UPI001C2D2CF9|nr:AmmeMemoRadiSam system protein A [Marinobacterium ramblicola]MBV1786561.1 AmmeMemoRadiSam system protein A [Marinobacterium ramblicola]